MMAVLENWKTWKTGKLENPGKPAYKVNPPIIKSPLMPSPISFAAPIFSIDRKIFFQAATEVSDIEKIACIMQKMFFIQATMFLSNEKIILNMGTIFPIVEKIIGRLAIIFCISQTKDLHTQIKVEGSKNIILPTIFLVNN
jgi:hypothetical protein